MAQGDIVFFNQFLEDEGRKIHNLEVDQIKIGLTTGATLTPIAGTANPNFGGIGGNDFTDDEVVASGNYTVGGEDLLATFSQAGGTATFSATQDPVTWTKNAANPSNARWGIIYNSDSTQKECIAFVDLGSPAYDMRTGDLIIDWDVSGIGTKTAA